MVMKTQFPKEENPKNAVRLTVGAARRWYTFAGIEIDHQLLTTFEELKAKGWTADTWRAAFAGPVLTVEVFNDEGFPVARDPEKIEAAAKRAIDAPRGPSQVPIPPQMPGEELVLWGELSEDDRRTVNANPHYGGRPSKLLEERMRQELEVR